MISTLVRIGPEFILPQLIEYTEQLLGNPALGTVTRDEYGMFLCREGELYDKSLLQQ